MSTAERSTVRWSVLCGDVLDRLRELPDESVQCVVTSPPYWGLRDYGTATWTGGDPACEHAGTTTRTSDADVYRGTTEGPQHPRPAAAPHRGGDPWRCACGAVRVDQQIGLEPTLAEFLDRLVDVFREVRRVLRPDGVCWLNMGDAYASKTRGTDAGWDKSRLTNPARVQKAQAAALRSTGERHRGKADGLKEKDLMGQPWRLALALQDDGWWLRAEVIWHKLTPMPESVSDRPTRAHEQVFMLTKAPRYFYDAEAVREPDKGTDHARTVLEGQPSLEPSGGVMPAHRGLRTPDGRDGRGANKRSVWTLPPAPYPAAHFATFPTSLVEPCILAGTSEHGACVECGAPWRRVVERLPTDWNGAMYGERAVAATGGAITGGTERSTLGSPGGAGTAGRQTLRWEPTCPHSDVAVRPCVVLDPFNGAATTGVVALRLDRSYIGIELNPEYVELSRRRIIDDAPLLNGPAEADPFAPDDEPSTEVACA